MTIDMARVDVDALEDFVRRAFVAMGLSAARSRRIAPPV